MKRTAYPSGMRSRRGRDNTRTFYLIQPDGTRLMLGQDFRLACQRWVDVQQSQVQQERPDTALALLSGFQRCSLPSPSSAAFLRRQAELATLRDYFADAGDPLLDTIASEADFLTWYIHRKHATSPDAVVRIFRHVWIFAQELEIVGRACPWKSLDLSKVRLKLEAADVVYRFASAPLTGLLEELLGKRLPRTIEPHRAPSVPDDMQYLQVLLKQAASTAVAQLRACGRMDLVAPVYQLTIDDLLSLRGSPILSLVRPPGRISLEHRRREYLNSLKTPTQSSRESKGLDGSASVRLRELSDPEVQQVLVQRLFLDENPTSIGQLKIELEHLFNIAVDTSAILRERNLMDKEHLPEALFVTGVKNGKG
ncbi:hypothetical protein PQQ72_01930 [Paraburkholderia strydomiana]|uniref:hypothetical protein n=1 Tax=Paraburkholderia strydomiana TaxID=1245417 RepID=UPI0038B6E0BA